MSAYLVAAYAVVWLLPFGLLVSFYVRQRRIEAELAALSVRLAEVECAGGENGTSEQLPAAPKVGGAEGGI
jgi:hypothetical protein